MRRQEPSEQFARTANGIGLADVPELRSAFVEVVGLGETAADPAYFVECGKRGSRRGRVRRLAVVDEKNVPLFADALHSMRQAGESLKPAFYLILRQSNRE